MRVDFDLIFERCLQKLRAGHTLEDCLAEYPEQAEQLRPLLEMALELGRSPRFETRTEAFSAGRQRMLEALDGQRVAANAATAPESGRRNFAREQKTAVSSGRFPRYAGQIQTFFRGKIVAKLAPMLARKESVPMKLVFSVVLSLAVVLFTLVTAVGNVSAASLPGDALYPVKRAQENVQLFFASDEARQQLEERFLQERHAEVQALIGLKRSAAFEFVADIEQIASQEWMVGGFSFTVNADTAIDDTLAVGSKASVRVHLQADGTLVALEVREARVIGRPWRTKTPLPLITDVGLPSPVPTCTAVACADGKRVCPGGKCPHGCGMICKRHTPTPPSIPSTTAPPTFACTAVACPNGKLVCPSGDCPGGCGMVCEPYTVTPTDTRTPSPSPFPVCTAVACPNGRLVCPSGDCPGGCGMVCEPYTVTPTDTRTPSPSPFPVCTPVACPNGRLVCPSGDCPGGCGMVCKPYTVTPTDTRTPSPSPFPVCTAVACPNGRLVCPSGDCPGGCGMVCEPYTVTPTDTRTPSPSPFPVCTAVACPNGKLVCPSGDCPGGCGMVCEPYTVTPTDTRTPSPSPFPVCTPVPCPNGNLVCPSGDCPGGCGMVCRPHTATPIPMVLLPSFCAPVNCSSGKRVCPRGDCSGGCGMGCEPSASAPYIGVPQPPGCLPLTNNELPPWAGFTMAWANR